MSANKLGTYEEAFFLEPKDATWDEYDDAEFDEDLDFGMVNRELLAFTLKTVHAEALGEPHKHFDAWLAVADAAVAMILEEG